MGVKEQLHIMAVPCPAQSHISALMYLCKRLAAEPGVLITFVNVDSIHEQMLPHWSPPEGLNINLDFIPFAWKLPNGFDAYCADRSGLFVDMSEKFLVGELSSLITRLSNTSPAGPVRCIISDYYTAWTQYVAEEHHIPRVAFCPGGASWASIEYHIPELSAKGLIFKQDRDLDMIVDSIGGLSPIRVSQLPAYLETEDHLWKEHGLKRSKEIQRAAWVFINSFYKLEKPAFDFLREEIGERCVPVGPLFLLDKLGAAQNVILLAEDTKCIDWLDKQQSPGSVLYISFGSIALLTREQFEELSEALKSCRVPFLWVIRPDMITGLPEEVYSAFLDSFSEQGLVVSWVPQPKVLKHPSVGGFLTHCGWNSMLESISCGIPMVGWPWAGEQNMNCKLMVEDWEIGVGLDTTRNRKVDREEIVRAVKSVMEPDSFLRANVKKLKVALDSEAVKEAETNLVALIEELRRGLD